MKEIEQGVAKFFPSFLKRKAISHFSGTTMLLAILFFVGILECALGDSSITFQTSYSWLDETCISSKSAIKSVEVDSGEQVCAAFCAANSQNCRGYISDLANKTCELISLDDQLVCSPAFQGLQRTMKVQAYEPKSKLGIYFGLPTSGIAHPISNKDLPTLSIPMNQDSLEMTIAYKDGILGCTGNRKCLFWKFGTNEWSTFASPQDLHHQGRMVLLEGKPLLIAGSDSPAREGSFEVSVEVYEEADNQWHNKAPIPIPTRNFAAVVANNGTKVFILGGARTPNSLTNDVFSFELSRDTWEKLSSPIPAAIGGSLSALVTLPDNRHGILLVGGIIMPNKVHELAHFLDLSTMTWETLASFGTYQIHVYNGHMVQTEESLYIIPRFQEVLLRAATNILIRNMSNMNNNWEVESVNGRFDLNQLSQIILLTKEQKITWIST